MSYLVFCLGAFTLGLGLLGDSDTLYLVGNMYMGMGLVCRAIEDKK